MLLKSVFIGFLSFHSVDVDALKDCENEADKISGCVEKEYDLNVDLWIETPYQNGKKEGVEKRYYENGDLIAEIAYKNEEIISGKCTNGKAFNKTHLHNLEKCFGSSYRVIKEICEKP